MEEDWPFFGNHTTGPSPQIYIGRVMTTARSISHWCAGKTGKLIQLACKTTTDEIKSYSKKKNSNIVSSIHRCLFRGSFPRHMKKFGKCRTNWSAPYLVYPFYIISVPQVAWLATQTSARWSSRRTLYSAIRRLHQLKCVVSKIEKNNNRRLDHRTQQWVFGIKVGLKRTDDITVKKSKIIARMTY